MKKSVKLLVVAVPALIVTMLGGGALWEYHERPQFCAICHPMQPYLDSWTGSEDLVYTHAEQGITCLDCHEPTIPQQVTEVAKFVTGQFETPLETRSFSEDFCLKCHEHGTLDEIIERTKDVTILNVSVNPHDPHPGVDASVVKHFECWTCHRMHENSPKTEYCFNVCHHDRTFEPCEKCH